MPKFKKFALTTFMTLVGLSLVGPSLAQNASAGPEAMQRQTVDHQNMDARTARPGPTTQELNRASSRYVDARAGYRARKRAYSRSMRRDEYRAAMRSHYRSIDRHDRIFGQRRMAYDRAMMAWRKQVRACHHGNRHACHARTPRTRDFY